MLLITTIVSGRVWGESPDVYHQNETKTNAQIQEGLQIRSSTTQKNTYTLLLRDETHTETRRGRFRFTANQTVCHFLFIPELDRAGPLGRGETDVLN